MKIHMMLMIAAALGLSGCSSTTLIVSRGEPAPSSAVKEPGHKRAAHSAKKLGIPPGHLPPPGKCRIWYPGRPPGHQPPPGSCASLARKVPPGAWLVSREGGPGRVRVSVYDDDRPGALLSVRIYSAADGRLLEED